MFELSKTIRKGFLRKFLTAALVLAAAVLLICLICGWIISGDAKSAFRRLEFELSLLKYPPSASEWYMTDSLKPGRYLLQRDWGLDETDYIEIFDDGTLRFSGEYWLAKKSENLAEDPDYYNHKGFADKTERTAYVLNELAPLVEFPGASDVFSYTDENTLAVSRARDEINDVTDFNHEPNDPDTPRYSEDYVSAHYIYVGGE